MKNDIPNNNVFIVNLLFFECTPDSVKSLSRSKFSQSVSILISYSFIISSKFPKNSN